jgi:hypothetical protein
MTDNELADVLAQYISAVRAKLLQSKASANVPTRAERARKRSAQALKVFSSI